MTKKKIFLILILPIIIIISLTVGAVALLLGAIFYNPLWHIKPDSTETPNYVVYDTLYSSYGEYDLSEICKEKEGHGALKEAFCVYKDKVYVVDYYKHTWVLDSIDLNSLEITTLGEIPENPSGYDRTDSCNKEYKERSGYYYDGKIVVNNQRKVMVHDLDEGTTEYFSYDEYVFPERSVKYIPRGPVSFQLDTENKLYDFYLSNIAEQSDTLSKMYEHKSNLRVFWSEYAYCVTDNKLYTVGRCMNKMGESFAVLMECDLSTEEWKYIKSIYVSENPHRYVYVIP